MHHRMNRTSCRRGAAMVEFALILPVLVLILFGVIEFGRMVMVHQVLVNASREGARLAVLPGTTSAQVQNTIDGYMASAGITGHTATFPDPNTIPPGQSLTVSVSVPYEDVSWGGMYYLGDAELEADVVMRRE